MNYITTYTQVYLHYFLILNNLSNMIIKEKKNILIIK